MCCEQCNKFVAFDTDNEPEVDVEVDDDGVVRGNARIVNTCADCGSEMTEATFEIEADVSSQVEAHRAECKNCKRTALSVDAEASRFDEYAEKDRRGKPIKSFRYRKHYYGVEIEITVTAECGESFSDNFRDKIQGSGMEGLM